MFKIEIIDGGQKNVITIAAEEIDTICRLCLNKDALVNLFEIAYKGTLFSEIFDSCFAQLNRCDTLPKKICNKCVLLFTQFCAFKEQILLSQALLESLLGSKTELDYSTENTVQIKEENDNLDICYNNLSHEEVEGKETVDGYSVQNLENNIVKEEVNDYDQYSETVNVEEIVVDKNVESQTKQEEEEKVYTCSFCDKKFINRNKYEYHRKKELSKRRPKKICHICSKAVTGMKLHLITHSKEKPFSCEVCGMKFSRRENIARHKYRHAAVKPHMCHICGKGFIQAPSLTDHLRTHNAMPSFVSQYCGQKFKSKQTFDRHLKLHETNPEWKCKERKCRENAEKAYICEYCKKVYKTRQMLEVHTRSHTGDRPFACSICGSMFVQSAHLRTHLYIHKGEKPHSCSYCGKSFALKGNLNQHIQIHTGNRPYSCNLCQKRFYTRSNLKKHKVVHDEK